MTKSSQPVDAAAAAQNRKPHLIIRASCIATCLACSVAANVTGTRYSANRAPAIATKHHTPRPIGTSATRQVQTGADVRRNSQPIQARSAPRAAAKTTIIMDSSHEVALPGVQEA
jgi:hypothetical protein